ncbi:MAG: hypothetical protein GEU74_04560 [Nitriliruptorales bacterium]|nr:hypothetical protein [Nitriliruptorales bacterium]
MRRFLSVAAVYVTIMLVASVLASPRPPTVDAGPLPDGSDGIVLAAALERFDDCDALLRYFREAALERVGPYGLGEPIHAYLEDSTEAVGDAGVLRSAAPAAGGDASADTGARDQDFSGTNVQEAGVDEPDIVKTDGRRIVVLSGSRLYVLVNDGDRLRRTGSVRLPGEGAQELLLDGDRVLALGHRFDDVMPHMDDVRASMPIMGAPTSTFTMVDISDASDPSITSTMEMDGSYVSARLVDGVARVVVRSQPAALPFVTPDSGGLRNEREAERRNREVVRDSTIDQWLPFAITTDTASGSETERSLLECESVHHPETFAGFGLVSVLSIDLTDELVADGSAAVVAESDTVYASTENLYVALNRWGSQSWDVGRPVRPEAARTELHQFDITDPARATYVASGTVKGRLLNQWALSEHDGHLRVATTQDGLGRAGRSDSAVVVLARRGGSLDPVGRVGGLGKGEQIYSVRYAGDLAYVVTFRQVDPLYTLDLSDPRSPEVRGELKIEGYSAYLHPIDDATLLGVGQDATLRGETTGSQVSLFDVGDLSRPRRVDQVKLGQGMSSVEYDHRAFLHWPATGTVVVPLETWEHRPFVGAVVLSVDGDGLQRVGRISHEGDGKGRGPGVHPYGSQIQRALVIDGELFTVSAAGVMAHSLRSLEPRGWVPLDRPGN